MAETTLLDDFITETDLMEKFGIKYSTLNRARKRDSLPFYQIGAVGTRLYLKQEVTAYFLSCKKVSEKKAAPRTKKATK